VSPELTDGRIASTLRRFDACRDEILTIPSEPLTRRIRRLAMRSRLTSDGTEAKRNPNSTALGDLGA